MHMADALISPLVGGTLWAATAATASFAVKKIHAAADDQKIPLMGVMGAFVFTAQMINFTIPGTGSSGHLGGGLLLAALLGPHAGFLAMASVLLIQALFFGDGGLLAFGCNVINLGFFASYVALPLVFRPLAGKNINARRIMLASILASLVTSQLGAFSVVLETVASGKTELPFGTFVLLMQPIHLAIGLVEGLVTGSVLTFIWKMRPELIPTPQTPVCARKTSSRLRPVIVVVLLLAILTGGVMSWFASSKPDGLEWSITQTTGSPELTDDHPLHRLLAIVQEKTALMPDYRFKSTDEASGDPSARSLVQTGTSVAGLLGGALTLLVIVLSGQLIYRLYKQKAQE